MYELRIFDRQRRFPKLHLELEVAIERIAAVAPDLVDGDWDIVLSEHGYGAIVCGEIEERLCHEPYVRVSMAKLWEILAREDEYFEHVRLCRTDKQVELGVFDSTWLFVRAERSTLETLANLFEQTAIVKVERYQGGGNATE